MKDPWDKIEIIGILLIPIIVSCWGWKVDNSLKRSDIKLKYIELALDILRDQPKRETKSLRLWAIKVVSRFSLVEFDKNALDELKNIALPSDSNILLDTKGRPILDVNGKPIPAISR